MEFHKWVKMEHWEETTSDLRYVGKARMVRENKGNPLLRRSNMSLNGGRVWRRRGRVSLRR